MSGEQSAFNINQLAIHLCESQTSTICKEECPVLRPGGLQRQSLLQKSQDLDCNRLYIFIQVHNESQRLTEAEEVRTHTAVFRKFEVSCDYCIACQLILNKLILWTGPRWCSYSSALPLHSHYSIHTESLTCVPHCTFSTRGSPFLHLMPPPVSRLLRTHWRPPSHFIILMTEVALKEKELSPS